MASRTQGVHLADLVGLSTVRLFFEVDSEAGPADISFESMLRNLNENGCRLTVELAATKKAKNAK